MRYFCFVLAFSSFCGCEDSSSLNERISKLESRVTALESQKSQSEEPSQLEKNPPKTVDTLPPLVTLPIPPDALSIKPGGNFVDADGQEVKKANRPIEYAGFHPDVPGKGMLNYWSSFPRTASSRTVVHPIIGDVIRSVPFELQTDSGTLTIYRIDGEGVVYYTLTSKE